MTTTPPIIGARFAVGLGVLLLAGFTAMAVLTTRDRAARTTLETLEIPPTGVGEPAGVPRPVDYEQAAILTHDGGKPLYWYGVDAENDSIMLHAGFDDSGKIRLYRRFKKQQLRETLYAKVAPGEYLKLSTTPRQPKEAPAAEAAPPAEAQPPAE